jgi:hypothetical protein
MNIYLILLMLDLFRGAGIRLQDQEDSAYSEIVQTSHVRVVGHSVVSRRNKELGEYPGNSSGVLNISD